MSDKIPVIILGGSQHLREIDLSGDDRHYVEFPKKKKVTANFNSSFLDMAEMLEIERYRRNAMLIAAENEKTVLIIDGRELPTFDFFLRRECLIYDSLSDKQAEHLFFSTFYGPGF